MNALPRVLVLGGSGQVGSELRRELGSSAETFAPTRAQLDCSRLALVEEYVSALAPDVVINAVAYTRVDDAEHEREAAQVLNAELPKRLAACCARVGAGLVHFSTDYVFSGDGSRPYREDDRTGPLNWYGETKLAGEAAVIRETDRAIVIRTSWIYGGAGHNFHRTMLRLARQREEIRVVDDQRGAPTWARDVAQGAVAIIGQLGTDPVVWHSHHGLYHMSAAGETTWFGFASKLLELDPLRVEHVVRRLLPITSEEYPQAASRPRYSVLDSSRAAERFGIRLPSWDRQLEVMSKS